MSAPRAAAPQVSLKDRIAALQQRTTSPPAEASTSSSSVNKLAAPNGSNQGSLKDKISKFEERGGTPVPRGSFGLGALPAKDGATKSRELYGNRIPSVSRLTAQYTGLTTQYTGGLTPQTTGRSDSLSIRSPELKGADAKQRPISAFGFDVSYHSGEVPPVPDLPSLYQGQGALAPDDTLSESPASETPAPQQSMPVPSKIVTVKESAIAPLPSTDQKASPAPADPAPDSVPPDSPEKSMTVQEAELDSHVESQTPDKGDSTPTASTTPTLPSSGPAQTVTPQPSSQVVSTPQLSSEVNDAEDTHLLASSGQDALVASTTQEPANARASSPTPASSQIDNRASRSMSVISANEALIVRRQVSSPTRAVLVPAPIVVPPPDTYVDVEPSPLPDAKQPIRSFHAVVHKKVTEDVHLVGRTQQTPQIKRVQSSTMDPPPSPGGGDLASLLMNAALLEEQLSGGGLPSPGLTTVVTPTIAVESDESGSRTLTPVQESFAQVVDVPSPSSSSSHHTLHPNDSPDSIVFPSDSSRSQEEFPPTPPPKSARTRYFSRSLRSIRHSMSLSSEDSDPVVTPPLEELSPPKGSVKSTMSRATSFVERIRSRKRTKSTVSTASTTVVDPTDEEMPEASPPTDTGSARPVSWANTSSTTSSPMTDIFDPAFFDEFPAVPQDLPAPPSSESSFLKPPLPPMPPQHQKSSSTSFLSRATTLPSRGNRDHNSNSTGRHSMETQAPPRASIIRRKHY
ncbi:hypothetical protein OE88DRAFT_877845 [Heliocybe sulcata]|uniref:Uncharacterized protein n=1 Tax=Heliocybe sulcata TaxID=5364 RepID=A0A5C3MPC9_9AGAM|nr:hypothetical protein OE88DRAFT_877845 [Heliocybe sulcata]